MVNCYSEILLIFFYGLHYPYNFILCFVLCIFCIVFSVNSCFSALACSKGLNFVASLVVSFKFSLVFNKSS
ncbi:hypothetical protein C2S43_08005 [Helicobacter pylori]|nr:hypothetical protein C2S43_08005 [Helicobacter pylori]